ncbi:zinc knuckle-domain-containing protein [Xylaria sp. FL1777]|nr:zinc knuckle-domain-containing protein [Xylaria sp. FL1777]
MYRRGPSRSTPANVQCQKCLKRGHYSYECKASAQERPYIPRPSRTQQLLNPKLVPKLASDTAAPPQDKKGLADQELAKREAERARKRELEQSDDTDNDVSKRERSPSYDSVSTISTRRSLSPSHRRVSMSRSRSRSRSRLNRDVRSSSVARGSPRRRSFDSGSDYDYPSSKGHTEAMKSPESARHRTRLPSRHDSPRHERLNADEQPTHHRHVDRRRRRHSQSPSQSPPPESKSRFRSRSPHVPWRPDSSPPRYHDRSGPPPPPPPRGRNGQEQRGGRQRNARERSLSPFSKRLALTQAMNAGQ